MGILSVQRRGKMAKKKVYAVKKGKVTGLFDTWEKCRAAVHGYPGAEYKSFSTEEEAEIYLGYAAERMSPDSDMSAKNAGHEKTEEHPPGEDGLAAYVDGSFDSSVGRYAFGCILLVPDGREIRISGSGDNPESLAIRNVAGEMLGAMHAVKWAAGNGFDALKIYYDYEGIEKWARGLWKAKNPLTQKYAQYMMKNNRTRVRVSFQKVAAHTGDFYNEEADKLARSALTETENGTVRMEEKLL